MMLDTTRREIPAFVANVHTAAHIDGRTLDRQLRKCSPSQRAVIADDLRTGRLELGPLTARQAQRLARGVPGLLQHREQTDGPRAACRVQRLAKAFRIH
jgi:hypothetical protein